MSRPAHNMILTDAQKMRIRSLYAQGDITQQALAERFGVKQNRITQIVKEKVLV